LKPDIPTDKEKEEEWEKINPKMLPIYHSRGKRFPTVQSRAAKNFYHLTPIGAITSYFPHRIRRDIKNNKGYAEKFGQMTKIYG
jgi:hypothetical protein